MRARRVVVRVLGGAATVWMAIGCSDQEPTLPEIRAAAGGGGGSVTVTATDPDSATQDTTLDVIVTGSGFDQGSQAQWAISGVPSSKVRTNSTRFVTSKKLIANITITIDADTGLYDVMVTASTGKKGIGSELFAVRAKNNGLGQSTANPEFAYGGNSLALEVMNANGSNRTPIFECPLGTGSVIMQPSWAAEGNGTATAPWHIAFVCNSADFWDVWRVDVDTAGGQIHGTNANRLAVGAGYAAWSPATGEVAFANVQASPQGLEVVPAGGGPRQILYTPPPGGMVFWSTWRPNGSHLAFVQGGDGNARVLLLDRATGAVTTLIGPGVFGSIRFIDWARHRDALAFSASPVGGGGESVYTLELDASLAPLGVPKRIVGGGGPSWSPDDRKLAYEASSRVLIIDLATGKKSGVASGADWSDWRR